MAGPTAIGLILAIVLGMLVLTELLAVETTVTTLTGGLSGFWDVGPQLFLIMFSAVLVLMVAGIVGWVTSNR